MSDIQRLLHEDVPAAYPIFYQYLSAHTDTISGVRVSALGHMKFEKASNTA